MEVKELQSAKKELMISKKLSWEKKDRTTWGELILCETLAISFL